MENLNVFDKDEKTKVLIYSQNFDGGIDLMI